MHCQRRRSGCRSICGIVQRHASAAIVDKLYQETRRILLLPEVRSRFEPAGTNIVGNSPAEFAKIIRDDFARWAGVIKAAGVKMD